MEEDVEDIKKYKKNNKSKKEKNMELNLYSIKDTVVGEFMTTFELRNNAEALRSFEMDIKHADKNKVPVQDYQLYKLGTKNTETGVITSDVQYLAKAIDFLGGETWNTTQTQTDHQNNLPTQEEN